VQFEDEVDNEDMDAAEKHDVQLLTLAELMKAGKENIVPADPPKPEDISTICYTSGTTGDPKGVMLSHANFAAESVGYDFVTSIYPSDVYIAYLPLAHVYERSIHAKVIKDGGRIGFYQGDVAKIVDDMVALKPTIFVTVPRLLNRIYDKISHGVASASSIKRALFEHAYKSKEGHLANGGYLTHGLWDPVVFGKFQALMGGHMRLIINGSAPITKEVKQFYQIVFACTVLEGYGLTETCAAFTCSTAEMPVGNHVGVPLPGLEARLEDVPEMNYTSNDSPKPRGEVLLRGATVFKGYFKAEDKTKEVLDADGWFHTGDIGTWNEDGTLSIVDRKKNIFKLQQGEYIAPEKIEAIYSKSRFVAQVFVHGDSHKNYLVGVVVPNEHAIEHWLEERQASGKPTSLSSAASSASSDSTGGSYTLEQLCQDPEVQRVVAEDLEEIGKQYKLFRFERVQKLHLTPEAFALENDLLTPTFKLKRPQLKQRFAQQIEAMYAQQ
jgi:long-chain acyl-CoA synthetase